MISTAWLALRSIAWTLLIPGVVVGYIPWRYFGLEGRAVNLSNPLTVAGLACMAGGAALLIACVFEFARSGRGTLSPVDPPRELVAQGMYRYVRNPMYLSVSVILLGETLLARSAALAAYAAVWFGLVNVFVMGYEEPWLRHRFGASYDEYANTVGRWIPTSGTRKSGGRS